MTTTIAQLNGLYKEVYAPDIKNLIPKCAKITRKVDFSSDSERIGNAFHCPVILNYENGFSYGSGAFTLNTQIPMTMKDAQITSSNLILKSVIPYDAASRANGSKAAFEKTVGLVMRNSLESAMKRTEIAILYGQTGIANVQTRTNTDATHTVHTISTADWASGIWAGFEGGQIDYYQTNLSTKINTTGALTVDSVNLTNRTLTISGAAGDITAIDSYVNSNPGLAVIFYLGANNAGTFNEFAGLEKIITNTGTLFNISAATYNLWKGNVVSSGSAALTFGKLIAALSESANRGLSEETDVYLNPLTWGNIATDQAALRRYGADYSSAKAKNGTQEITFYSQTGVINLTPHLFVKEGDAFIVPIKQLKRIGSTDWTPNNPGREQDEIFFDSPTTASFEMRLYTDQAIFCQTPAQATIINTIVNA